MTTVHVQFMIVKNTTINFQLHLCVNLCLKGRRGRPQSISTVLCQKKVRKSSECANSRNLINLKFVKMRKCPLIYYDLKKYIYSFMIFLAIISNTFIKCLNNSPSQK